MQVQAITPHLSFAGVKKQNKFNSTDNFQKLSYTKDSFEKQNLEISFTANKKENKKDNLGSSLSNIKMKGLPFLLGVVTSAAMVKMGENAAELLCDEDGYLVSEDGVTSDLVNIDVDNQILEFKGTGISINADDYDYVDWENGIFKNHDGSVDINFGESRFIDTINGIIVDSDHQVSGILDNGIMQPMAVPSFKGYQTWPYPMIYRSDHEELMKKEHERIFGTQEEKSPFEKASDFIKGLFQKDSMPQVDGTEDIFGNEIIVAKDNNGDTYLASYLQKEIDASPVFADFRMKFGKEAATERVSGERLEQYIETNYPNFGTRVLAYEGGRNATGGIGDYKKNMESLEERHRVGNKKGLAGILEEFDTDKDGKLSSDELQNYIQSLSRDEKGNLDKEGTAGFLKLFDKNQDGEITIDEIMETFDLNGDGSVSLDEAFSFFDFDGDGVTTVSEFFEGIMKLFLRTN